MGEQQRVEESLKLEVVALTGFWKTDRFQQCFGDGALFSAQCYIQLAFQDHICLNLGPHSGGTDYIGMIGSPVIFWTATDHPAHPRMPRLTQQCPWWWCLPVGSVADFKAAKEMGFSDIGKGLLKRAIGFALSQTWQEQGRAGHSSKRARQEQR